MTAFVFMTCLIAATGGLIFGYVIGMSGGVTSMDSKFVSQLLTMFTSSLYFAALVASFFASIVTRKFGWKWSMMFGGGITFLVGAAINIGAAVNVLMLILLGIGLGFANQGSEAAITSNQGEDLTSATPNRTSSEQVYENKNCEDKNLLKEETSEQVSENMNCEDKNLLKEETSEQVYENKNCEDKNLLKEETSVLARNSSLSEGMNNPNKETSAFVFPAIPLSNSAVVQATEACTPRVGRGSVKGVATTNCSRTATDAHTPKAQRISVKGAPPTSSRNQTALKIANQIKQQSNVKQKSQSPAIPSMKSAKQKNATRCPGSVTEKTSMATDFARENQAINRQKLDGGKSRQLSLHSDSSYRDHQVPRITFANPFHLHTEERGLEKEKQITFHVLQKQLEEERARIPKANPYPYTTVYPVIPPKPEPKQCTKPEAFQLESLVRHEEEMQRKLEEKERMEKEEAQRRLFRAQPVLKEDPIPLPEKARKPLTDVQEFVLHADQRAVQRSEFDKKIKEKEIIDKRLREDYETTQQIEEEKVVKQMRRRMVHHARPLPKFHNPFQPQKSTKETTKPKAPYLHVSRRGERSHASHLR